MANISQIGLDLLDDEKLKGNNNPNFSNSKLNPELQHRLKVLAEAKRIKKLSERNQEFKGNKLGTKLEREANQKEIAESSQKLAQSTEGMQGREDILNSLGDDAQAAGVNPSVDGEVAGSGDMQVAGQGSQMVTNSGGAAEGAVGGAMAGLALGTMGGAKFGPQGAAIGAVVGGTIGAMKASAAKKAAKRAAEAEALKTQGMNEQHIINNREMRIQSALKNMGARIGATLGNNKIIRL